MRKDNKAKYNKRQQKKSNEQKLQRWYSCCRADQQDLIQLNGEWDHGCSVCHHMQYVCDNTSAIAQRAQIYCLDGLQKDKS